MSMIARCGAPRARASSRGLCDRGESNGRISTAGSYRAMLSSISKGAHIAIVLRLPHLGRLQTRSIAGAENARLRTSLTTVLTSSKIGSRRMSMRPDRGARIALWRSRIRPCFLLWVPPRGVLEYLRHRVQHTLMPPKTGPILAYIFYQNIQQILGKTPPEIACHRRETFNNLPTEAQKIAVSYCQNSIREY
jgi:hypothetical protein